MSGHTEWLLPVHDAAVAALDMGMSLAAADRFDRAARALEVAARGFGRCGCQVLAETAAYEAAACRAKAAWPEGVTEQVTGLKGDSE